MKFFNRRNAALLGLVIVLGLLAAACSGLAPGEVFTLDRTVELDGAREVRAEIDMGAGILTVSDGAPALMEAEFIYNITAWEPQVSYEVTGSTGLLEVRQPQLPDINLGNNRYEWDLQFAGDVPLDLQVRLGAGQYDLRLQGLTLSNLDVQVGAGRATIDISGERGRDLQAMIRGGVGDTSIILPEQIGTRVQVQGGISTVSASGLTEQDGAFVNDLYGETEHTLEVQVEAGIGAITLETAN